MRLNFYSKLIVLLLAIIPHCFASAAVELASDPRSAVAAAEQARVDAGLRLIETQDSARCGKYNGNHADINAFSPHTNKIDALLSDESRVSRTVEASDAAIRAIVTAAIDDKITHRNDQSRHDRSSPVKEKFHSLDANNALYNYFHVLSLIEDVAESFVTGIANVFNSNDFGAIADSADSIYTEISALNLSITKELFTICLTDTYASAAGLK